MLRIFAEIEELREGGGERFTRLLDGTLQSLRRHPQMAPVFERPVRRLVAGNSGYGLFYTVEPRGIIVHALLHLIPNSVEDWTIRIGALRDFLRFSDFGRCRFSTVFGMSQNPKAIRMRIRRMLDLR